MDTARPSLSCRMRCTWDASKSNASPAGGGRRRGGPAGGEGARGRAAPPAGGGGAPAGGPAEDEPLLHDLALHHRHRAARDVVVVEARVAAVSPRDDPHVDVLVAPELLEVALGAPPVHEAAPHLRFRGDAADQLAQLAAIEVAATR